MTKGERIGGEKRSEKMRGEEERKGGEESRKEERG